VWTTYDKGVYQDLAMEMDGRKVSGSDTNDYGLIFRLVDRGNFYRFVVSSQGQYTLDQYLKSNWNTIKKWTTHSAIKKGTEINHLKVIAQGSTFQLYVNDTLVDTITDNSIPQAGKVALSGGSYDAPNVHVAFDNVQVLPAGVAFYDDFTDNRNNWTTSDKVFFDGGEYHLYDKESGRIVWNNSAGTYGNFTIEAKIRKVEGPDDKDYGIALRLLDADNYYSFTILGDGRYRFDKQVNNEWVFLLGPKESSALNKGNVTNILRVVCKGQTFDLYINGQKVDSVQDDFRSDGNIGFYTSQNVHMAVEYVTVWKE
jgi:hypothetical protein